MKPSPTFPTVQQLKNAKTITIKTGVTKSPPANKTWVILSGAFYHITGTASIFAVYADKDAQATRVLFANTISSSASSGIIPLFSTNAQYYTSQYSGLIVVGPEDCMKYTGGTNSLLNLKVVEI